MGMLSRDFEQMSDAKDGNITNMFHGWFANPFTQSDASGTRENVFSDNLLTLEHINNTCTALDIASATRSVAV